MTLSSEPTDMMELILNAFDSHVADGRFLGFEMWDWKLWNCDFLKVPHGQSIWPCWFSDSSACTFLSRGSLVAGPDFAGLIYTLLMKYTVPTAPYTAMDVPLLEVNC